MAYQISIPLLTPERAIDLTAMRQEQVCPVSGASRREEAVNCLTHAFGLVVSVAGFGFLMALATTHGDRWHVIGCAIYGVTLVMVYAASTLYHGTGSPTRKRLLRELDQAFVYLLIAGTYTPFALVPLHGGWGWMLFAIVWGVAIGAIGVKLVFVRRLGDASVPVYLSLGWLCAIAVVPLSESLPWSGIAGLVAGGVAYTLGAILLVRRPLPFSHGLWHVAVLIGSACHYFVIALYVIPSA